MGGLQEASARERGKSEMQAMIGAEMHKQGKKVLFVTGRPKRMVDLLARLVPSAWFTVAGNEVRLHKRDR